MVGQAYYQQKNYGEAVKLFGGLVEADEKAGRKPERSQAGAAAILVRQGRQCRGGAGHAREAGALLPGSEDLAGAAV